MHIIYNSAHIAYLHVYECLFDECLTVQMNAKS